MNEPMIPTLFGHCRGAEVHQVTLGQPEGLQAKVMTWGAVLCDLSVPVNGGRLPLTLGFDRFAPYPDHSPYFGAVVGRYANRIAHSRFSHAGQTYHLDPNEAHKTTLHGGTGGFSQCIWQIKDLGPTHVTLGLTSPDGDQGFPGRVTAECTYTLVDGHRLGVSFTATTDRPTPVNMAQHAYFNLDGSPDISDHSLQIFADAYTPVDADLIPTGEIVAVDGTDFDFRRLTPLQAVQTPIDHNFVLSEQLSGTDALRRAARLQSNRSGIAMLVETTKPGLQYYDGGYIAVPVPGHGGRTYGANAGLCLETQFYPDSPNQPAFPDTILHPGDTYRHRTLLSFESLPL